MKLKESKSEDNINRGSIRTSCALKYPRCFLYTDTLRRGFGYYEADQLTIQATTSANREWIESARNVRGPRIPQIRFMRVPGGRFAPSWAHSSRHGVVGPRRHFPAVSWFIRKRFEAAGTSHWYRICRLDLTMDYIKMYCRLRCYLHHHPQVSTQSLSTTHNFKQPQCPSPSSTPPPTHSTSSARRSKRGEAWPNSRR